MQLQPSVGTRMRCCCKDRLIANRVFLNPIALRKAKIAYNFGLSERNRVKTLSRSIYTSFMSKGNGQGVLKHKSY